MDISEIEHWSDKLALHCGALADIHEHLSDNTVLTEREAFDMRANITQTMYYSARIDLAIQAAKKQKKKRFWKK